MAGEVFGNLASEVIQWHNPNEAARNNLAMLTAFQQQGQFNQQMALQQRNQQMLQAKQQFDQKYEQQQEDFTQSIDALKTITPILKLTQDMTPTEKAATYASLKPLLSKANLDLAGAEAISKGAVQAEAGAIGRSIGAIPSPASPPGYSPENQGSSMQAPSFDIMGKSFRYPPPSPTQAALIGERQAVSALDLSKAQRMESLGMKYTDFQFQVQAKKRDNPALSDAQASDMVLDEAAARKKPAFAPGELTPETYKTLDPLQKDALKKKVAEGLTSNNPNVRKQALAYQTVISEQDKPEAGGFVEWLGGLFSTKKSTPTTEKPVTTTGPKQINVGGVTVTVTE